MNFFLIKFLDEEMIVSTLPIAADTNDSRLNEKIQKEGYNLHSADKAVVEGIRYLQQFKIVIDGKSLNLVKEIRAYKRKEKKDGTVLDEPVKAFDHLMDAMRYGAYTFRVKPSTETPTEDNAVKDQDTPPVYRDDYFGSDIPSY